MNLNTKEFFKKAAEGKYSIVQLNVSSADQMKPVAETAVKLKAPFIFGLSEGERDFLGQRQAVVLAEEYEKITGLPVIINADHTKSLEKVKEALDAGFNSIHIDASHLDYEENVKMTKEAVDMVKSYGENISVEGELGHIGGTGSSKVLDEVVEIDERFLTHPDQAKEFVERTGVDRLGVAIGNLHGISTKAMPKLDMNRLKDIDSILGDSCVLVLHGASGIPDDDIKKAVELGIRKINVNTELRIAFSSKLKEVLNSGETTPYKFIAPAQEEMAKVVESKILLCNSNNRA